VAACVCPFFVCALCPLPAHVLNQVADSCWGYRITQSLSCTSQAARAWTNQKATVACVVLGGFLVALRRTQDNVCSLPTESWGAFDTFGRCSQTLFSCFWPMKHAGQRCWPWGESHSVGFQEFPRDKLVCCVPPPQAEPLYPPKCCYMYQNVLVYCFLSLSQRFSLSRVVLTGFTRDLLFKDLETHQDMRRTSISASQLIKHVYSTVIKIISESLTYL
jgi:hypothetical protein